MATCSKYSRKGPKKSGEYVKAYQDGGMVRSERTEQALANAETASAKRRASRMDEKAGKAFVADRPGTNRMLKKAGAASAAYWDKAVESTAKSRQTGYPATEED